MSATNGTARKATKTVGTEATSLKTRVEELEKDNKALREEVTALHGKFEEMITGMKKAMAKQIMQNPQIQEQMEAAIVAKMGDGIPGLSETAVR